MKRYILTGTPGSGKTSIISALEASGIPVISEAATDVISEQQKRHISEPWQSKNFIDSIVLLQQERQKSLTEHGGKFCFYDRSPICTHALSVYLDYEPTTLLLDEIKRITETGVYERTVFFIENLVEARVDYILAQSEHL